VFPPFCPATGALLKLARKKAGENARFSYRFVQTAQTQRSLSELAFTGSLRLLFALNRRLFVGLSFAHLGNDSRFGALLFKAAKRTVKRFILFNTNFRHDYLPSPPPYDRGNKPRIRKILYMITGVNVKLLLKQKLIFLKNPANSVDLEGLCCKNTGKLQNVTVLRPD
jgi:hypothetical protein